MEKPTSFNFLGEDTNDNKRLASEWNLDLNPKVDIPLFATNANPLQLYHFPKGKILAFNSYHVTLKENVNNCTSAYKHAMTLQYSFYYSQWTNCVYSSRFMHFERWKVCTWLQCMNLIGKTLLSKLNSYSITNIPSPPWNVTASHCIRFSASNGKY